MQRSSNVNGTNERICKPDSSSNASITTGSCPLNCGIHIHTVAIATNQSDTNTIKTDGTLSSAQCSEQKLLVPINFTKQNLNHLMEEMIVTNPATSLNVSVYVHNQMFNCNISILISYSQYFRQRRFCKKIRLKNDITPAGFKMLYNWMVLDTATVRVKDILVMWKLAEFLEIDDLSAQCWAYISGKELIKEDLAALFYLEAQRLHLNNAVKEILLARLRRFFLIFIASKEFLTMSINDVRALLNSNGIAVNTEIEVFMAAIRWLDYDRLHRSQYCLKLMSCVRFKLVPGWFLVLLNTDSFYHETFRELLSDRALKTTIEDALTCVTSYLYLNQNKTFAMPPPRMWIYDKKCRYHSYQNFGREEISFRAFTKYLETLKTCGRNYWRNFIILKARDPLQPCFLSPLTYCSKHIETPSSSTLTSTTASPPNESPKPTNESVLKKTESVPLHMITNNKAQQCFLKKCECVSKHTIQSSTSKQAFAKQQNSSKNSLQNTKYFNKDTFNEGLIKDLHRRFFIFGGASRVNRQMNELNNPYSIQQLKCADPRPLKKRNLFVLNAKPHYGDEILCFNADKQQCWEEIAFIPSGSRNHHAIVFCNGLVYIIGGTRKVINDDSKKAGKAIFEKSVWSFNPATKQWNFVNILPEVRKDLAAVAVEFGFYAIGGADTNGMPLDTVWFYSIQKGKWYKQPSMNKARYGLTAIKFENKIWVAGGMTLQSAHGSCSGSQCNIRNNTAHFINKCSHCITDIVEYINLDQLPDVDGNSASSSQWHIMKERLRIPRLYGRFCITSNQKLYIIGGMAYKASNTLSSLSSIEYFDNERDTWKYHGELHVPRHCHDVIAINENILIVGGASTLENCAVQSTEVYLTDSHRSISSIAGLPYQLSTCSALYLELKTDKT